MYLYIPKPWNAAAYLHHYRAIWGTTNSNCLRIRFGARQASLAQLKGCGREERGGKVRPRFGENYRNAVSDGKSLFQPV